MCIVYIYINKLCVTEYKVKSRLCRRMSRLRDNSTTIPAYVINGYTLRYRNALGPPRTRNPYLFFKCELLK